MNTGKLALHLLWRDWRTGELRALLAALVIAVAAVSAIGLLTDRLGGAMTREASELIGGDLVIKSSRTPDPLWLEMGRELGLRSATSYEFNSVLVFGEELLLCSVKAVDNAYPLRGKLRIADQINQLDREIARAPLPGTAWVDARVLNRLGAAIGDEINFGATTLRVDKILTYEPDQSGSLFQMAPRVLINAADLDAAEVLGPGSRVRYRYLFVGENASALKEKLASLMTPGHELIDIKDSDSRPSQTLARAEQYLNLTALLTLILAAVTIALTARRYSQRHRDTSAMLRCLGAQRREIRQLYILQLLALAAGATFLGCLFGWVMHNLLLSALKPLLPPFLPPPGWTPLATALAAGILLCGGLALPPLLRLGNVPPLKVLRGDLPPPPLSGWLVSGFALTVFYFLLLLLFDDFGRLFIILSISLTILSIFGAVIYGLLRWLRRLRGTQLLTRSIRNLSGHAATTSTQILAFAATLMIMALIAQLRSELLDQWRLQLPENAPNHFAFNIQPDDLAAFQELLTSVDIAQPVYPIVRGRLVTINGKAVPVAEETDTNRELNLTWTTALPADNQIIAGEWLGSNTDHQVSVEIEYAQRLGIQLGDRLGIHVGGFVTDAHVTSFRTVKWESFSPNFYLIFTPSTLTDLPTTYLTSFYLPPQHKSLLRDLVQAFPAITLIEVEAVLNRLQLIIQQTTLAVEIMMVLVLLSGFTVMFATLIVTADERVQEGALLRAIGASRNYLRKAWLSEFMLIGFFAGLFAALGGQIARFYLYTQIFNLDYSFNGWWWLLLPCAASLVTATIGYLSTRQVVSTSPLVLLRQ